MRISDGSADGCSSDLAPADRSAGAPGEKQEDRTSRSAQARKREISMPRVSMTVNGRSVSGDVEGRTLLVQFLREHLRLTGTHVGCDTSQCGACVVHVDGESVRSEERRGGKECDRTCRSR